MNSHISTFRDTNFQPDCRMFVGFAGFLFRPLPCVGFQWLRHLSNAGTGFTSSVELLQQWYVCRILWGQGEARKTHRSQATWSDLTLLPETGSVSHLSSHNGCHLTTRQTWTTWKLQVWHFSLFVQFVIECHDWVVRIPALYSGRLRIWLWVSWPTQFVLSVNSCWEMLI